MEAAFARWPKAVIQFEDFQMKWAFETLQRYREKFCMFNDDIQGTAGVALAGLLGAVRAQGKSLNDFMKQKIVVVGAGSAGIGVLNMAKKAISRMWGNNEPFDGNQFWLIDKDGLITKDRKGIDPAAAPFARGYGPEEVEGLREGASLQEVVIYSLRFLLSICNLLIFLVKKVKPHVLLGLSGVGGIFNEEVLRAMQHSDSCRPAIFAMSNPTKNAECTPKDAFKYAGENIIFASGSPFENVDLGNGKVGYVNQANNMYLFPGYEFLSHSSCFTRVYVFSLREDDVEEVTRPTQTVELQGGEEITVLDIGWSWASQASDQLVNKGKLMKRTLCYKSYMEELITMLPCFCKRIGLGALLSGAKHISDGMLQAAAEWQVITYFFKIKNLHFLKKETLPLCLASYITDEDIQKGIIFPSISSIRHITTQVGAAVVHAAVAEGLAEGHGDVSIKELSHMSKEETAEYVARNMWYPIYSPLVHD
ncbi:hypothetical protein ZIOFF_045788 [Zingiber officinale]|uniref:Malic enzyme NAD-binding domain-containing protein n=1 Tax=Zingiber officinale TaxID=94328 RepID=A0A8J5GDG4_ZINOF|nr:hypothetical protein ZIOFF_045788 [Zingiber officinale]